MIEFLEMPAGNILGFRVEGPIDKEDVRRTFDLLVGETDRRGRMQMYAEIEGFDVRDISADAVREDIRLWLKHPELLPQIEKAALVTDAGWIRKIFDVECFLIPTLEGRSFGPGGRDRALRWLMTDQREPERLDITFSELVETSVLKFAGGFALGLLTAGLFGSRQRKAVGTAVLTGAVAGGIPLGLKVLNNNRRLLGCPAATDDGTGPVPEVAGDDR